MPLEPERPGSGQDPHAEVELGSVVGVFGFRGEVRLHLYNPDSDLLDKPKPVVLTAPDGRRFVGTLSARPGAGNRIIGRLAGVESEEEARSLRGYRISIAKAALPELEEGEYYVWQLQGARVFLEGEEVGKLVEVQSPGPTDIFVIERLNGRLAFIPALSEFIASVDVQGGRIALMPGALDEIPEGDEPEEEDEPR